MDNAYLLQSKSDKAKVYQYYSDILSYHNRYPNVYHEIKVISKLNNTLDAEIILLINFADEQYSGDVKVTARYTFDPPSEVRYEVIDGYGRGRINNSISIKEPNNHASSQGFLCEVDVNHLPLDIMSLEPHGLEETDPMYKEYLQKGIYLQTQDQIYLEGNESLQEALTKCPGCGSNNTLELTRRSEQVGNTTKREYKCSKCSKSVWGMSNGNEI